MQLKHDVIPEELVVSEIYCNKGMSQKQITYNGRGRAGFGYRKWSHVWLTISKIDFEQRKSSAKNYSQQQKWRRMQDLVTKLRESPEEFELKAPVKPRFKLYDAYDRKKPPRSR